ncbi:hypothetical protein Cadr_000000230 [Camelus dromedarius]|uniref:Uncharacterized protein n=1 Tax=Camelus dromedarius TaxID=9838 RepID=A0A5N4EKT7_CAMDR|nr:hypothetical protein Cadr_000000230 [Camelus dromedarius]
MLTASEEKETKKRQEKEERKREREKEEEINKSDEDKKCTVPGTNKRLKVLGSLNQVLLDEIQELDKATKKIYT